MPTAQSPIKGNAKIKSYTQAGKVVGLGWVGLGWVGLGWVGLGWVRFGRVGSGRVGSGGVGVVWGLCGVGCACV